MPNTPIYPPTSEMSHIQAAHPALTQLAASDIPAAHAASHMAAWPRETPSGGAGTNPGAPELTHNAPPSVA